MRAEVSMWSYTMISLKMSFIGAAAYHGEALDMDPQSEEYRNWVKKALIYLFTPPLEKLIQEALEKRR